MREGFLSRSRKFNPQRLFLSVLHLVASTNADGYMLALQRTWHRSGLKMTDVPRASSLSEFREKVSSKFFEDIFEEDLRRFSSARKTFRGYFVYAVDGDQLDLPASQNVLSSGYRGTQFSKIEETHYPKMYTVQAVDVINGEVTKFSSSEKISEVLQARALVKKFETKSIVIYDRLHQCYDTALAHEKAGSYFFVRVKSHNPKLALPIQDFCRSKRRSEWIDLYAAKPQQKYKPVLKVRLIKVKNKRSKEEMVFMTNMPEGLIKNKEAGELYLRRWGVENSFKDLTDTLKMCQWHTTKLNGIFQEIYALLWLVNSVRRLTSKVVGMKRQGWLSRSYCKSNFKLVAALLVDNIEMLINGEQQKLREIIEFWAHRSIERREHLSRIYPRQVKRHGKKYRNASRVPRRAAAV